MSNLYHLSSDTKNGIKKFRSATARSDDAQIQVIKIQPKPSYEIIIDDDEDLEDFKELSDLAELLPDNMPRFVLMSYPMTTRDGRKKTPLVMLYWKPPTVVSQEWKMLYAGALEMVRVECAVNKFIEVSSGLEDEDEIEELKQEIEAD
ncbi:YDR063W [Kluyveromyces marxianus]|uniref:YDR063W n=1 Tax=Kluyveromyces marxianus TaxID=4911 RepID=A0ABX6EVT5_KLUMA|nr:YDR063W [Kluyveromyces marxianus]